MTFILKENIQIESGLSLEVYEHDCGLVHYHVTDPLAQDHGMLLGFKTRPSTDDGRAHILEHLVLAGSKKFPEGDPFMGMISQSVASFINALTYPDSTRYPFGSPVEKDFFNLAKVYCDAVWNPLLTHENFQREGWRVEMSEDDLSSENFKAGVPATAKITGIVFNEMKGYESDPEFWRSHEEQKAILVKGSPEQINSGGDPLVIPSLTYEELKKFHKDFYSASATTLITVSKSISSKNIHDFLHAEFCDNLVHTKTPQITPFVEQHSYWSDLLEGQDKHEHVEVPFSGENGKGISAYIPLIAGPITRTEQSVLELLSAMFWEQSSSVIKQCMSNGLGDPAGGYKKNAGNHWLTVSFQNKTPQQVELVKSRLKQWCTELAANCPLDAINLNLDRVEASLRINGFATGFYKSSPAVSLASSIFESVLDGFDVRADLDPLGHLQEVRKALNDPELKTWKKLTQNISKGWVYVTSEAKEEYMERVSLRYDQAQAAFLSGLTAFQWEQIAQHQTNFQKAQEINAKRSQRQNLPGLGLADLDSSCLPHILQSSLAKGHTHLEIANNQINRVLVLKSLENLDLSAHEVWVLGKSIRVLNKMGLRLNGDLQDFSTRAAWSKKAYLSGGWSLDQGSNRNGEELAWLCFSAYVTQSQLQQMPEWFDSFSIKNLEWNQKDIFNLVIQDMQVEAEQKTAEDYLKVMPSVFKAQRSGHMSAQLKAILKDKEWTRAWGTLIKTDSGFSKICESVSQVWRKLEGQPEQLLSIGAMTEMQDTLPVLLQNYLPNRADSFNAASFKSYPYTGKSVVTHSSAGNYVYTGFEIGSLAVPELVAAQTVAQWMNRGLLSNIREKGGAYGASARIEQPFLVLKSYRDPRYTETLKDMDRTVEAAKDRKWEDDDLHKGALSLFKAFAPIRTLHEWAYNAAQQKITGHPHDWNKSVLDAITRVTKEHCAEIANKMLSAKSYQGAVAGVGEAIDQACILHKI